MRVFADDLVIIEDPVNSLPQLIDVINEFGILAGFYLNQNKSKIKSKNMTEKKINQLRRLTECEIVNKI